MLRGGKAGGLWSNVKHAHSPYCYRCSFGRTYPNCDLECAKDIEELICTSTSGRIAAFIAEPIQGVGGFITPPKEYFTEAVSIIRKYDGLFIADEVQTAWGRTGGKMFGIEHWGGVEPDIMTFAKGLANGAPYWSRDCNFRRSRFVAWAEHLHIRREPGEHGGGPGNPRSDNQE